MRRVVVPLDGTPFAAAILPDACRLAGPDGTIILFHDSVDGLLDRHTLVPTSNVSSEDRDTYLKAVAARLAEEGMQVEWHLLNLNDISRSIDVAAILFDADMIACATHGNGPLGRLVRGGNAWRAVANSSVPIMLRHFDETPSIGPEPDLRRILVPLDGSALAETALPVAASLAADWKAELHLMRVVPILPEYVGPYSDGSLFLEMQTEGVHRAHEYLAGIQKSLSVPSTIEAVFGSPIVNILCESIAERSITDIVLASHGRTSLSRAIIGSVADALIHSTRIPIVVVPAHAVVGDAAQPMHPSQVHTAAVV